MNEQEFLQKLKDLSETPIEIMPLDEINKQIQGISNGFNKRGMAKNEFTILSVKTVQEFEGICKFAVINTIPPGEKIPERQKTYFLYGEVLDSVITPIILKNADRIFFVLANQSRVPLNGKVSIEVLRGFTPKGIPLEERGLNLINRKMPSLPVIAKLVKTINLGNYFQNTGVSSVKIPVYAYFYETKVEMLDEDIKHELIDRNILKDDPQTGPALHNIEPVIRTYNEVNDRITTLLDDPEGTSSECYLNDFFSIASINLLNKQLDKNGFPYSI